MNIKQVIDNVTNKWPAKLICLILAVFLYILHQTTLIEKKTIVVPLTVIQQGNCTYVGNMAKNVTIVIRASQDEINTIQASEIQANINLDPYGKSGEYDVPVNLILSERLMALDPLEIKVKPEKINVNVEERQIKYVKVKPSIVEQVPYGYKIDSIECNPPYVEIMGAKSIVEEIEEVSTKRIPVSNAVNSFTAETSYYELNKLIDVPFKEPYKVTVAIVPETSEKDFIDLPISVMNLSDGFVVSNDLPKVSIKTEGLLLFLEKYNLPQNSIYINLKDIDEVGTYEIPVIVRLPGNLSLIQQSIDTVTVEIQKETLPIEENSEDSVQNKEEVVE